MFEMSQFSWQVKSGELCQDVLRENHQVKPGITLVEATLPSRMRSSGSLFTSMCCDQSTVAVRVCAGQASAKLAFFLRSSSASRTTDSRYPFGAEFFFHGDEK